MMYTVAVYCLRGFGAETLTLLAPFIAALGFATPV
jgi:hypothetical protein